MKMILQLQSIGFCLKPPVIDYQHLTTEMLKGISSRDFRHPYEDMQDMICGNLYFWLQQSYSVLWQVDEVNNKLVIHTNTTEKLGERFATLLRMSKGDGKSATVQMVNALATANYLAEKVVFNMEGNWLLKYRQSRLEGLLKLFVFWLASIELANNESALSCLHVFIKKFAKDFELQLITGHTEQAIMDAFIQCFFNCNNETALFILALQNPELSIHGLR
jgi:hypothetical protein